MKLKYIMASFLIGSCTFISSCKDDFADINTNPQFKSNEALRDAMGYILGMGFAFKAKPEAFASSSCANKVVN